MSDREEQARKNRDAMPNLANDDTFIELIKVFDAKVLGAEDFETGTRMGDLDDREAK